MVYDNSQTFRFGNLRYLWLEKESHAFGWNFKTGRVLIYSKGPDSVESVRWGGGAERLYAGLYKLLFVMHAAPWSMSAHWGHHLSVFWLFFWFCLNSLGETQIEVIWKKKICMRISNKGETNVKVVWCP